MTLVESVKRCYWWKRSTKIKLWATDSIGYFGGYYECHSEINAADLTYIRSWSKPGADSAKILWKQRRKDIERKYFGPKYIKA